jgi:orotate phosphoribosyltransferase
MTGPSDKLARRIYERCRLTGEFHLRSGAVSEEYFDKYLFESDPRLLREIAEALVDMLPEGVDTLAGLELGGVPFASVASATLVRPWKGSRGAVAPERDAGAFSALSLNTTEPSQEVVELGFADAGGAVLATRRPIMLVRRVLDPEQIVQDLPDIAAAAARVALAHGRNVNLQPRRGHRSALSVLRTEAVQVDLDEIAAAHRTQAIAVEVVKLAPPTRILLLQPADGLCEQRAVSARSAQLADLVRQGQQRSCRNPRTPIVRDLDRRNPATGNPLVERVDAYAEDLRGDGLGHRRIDRLLKILDHRPQLIAHSGITPRKATQANNARSGQKIGGRSSTHGTHVSTRLVFYRSFSPTPARADAAVRPRPAHPSPAPVMEAHFPRFL